ncbi:MAG TPA: DUF4395 domain-containing protein [Propionicimonas sp.]|jgi:hypothetical protein
MAAPTSPTAPRVDSRAPRWVGGFTFVLAVTSVLLALLRPVEETLVGRVLSPEFLLMLVLWLSFGAGTFWGNGAHPFAWVYRRLVQPRLSRPVPTEDARPPRFALGVGFTLTTLGLVLQAAGVPYGLAVAAAFVVVASFLQAFVGYCLGCQVYLLLVRGGLIRPQVPIAA